MADFDVRGSFAPVAFDPKIEPVPATGSSNVLSFRWQPSDPNALAALLLAIYQYGSAELAILADYGFGSGVLEVTFRDGRTYQYQPVTAEMMRGMLNAASRGRFVYEQLRRTGVPCIGPL